MTRQQIKGLAPYIGVILAVAALLGIELNGPGSLKPRVEVLEKDMGVVRGFVVAECLDPEKRPRLNRARVPCRDLLDEAGLE